MSHSQKRLPAGWRAAWSVLQATAGLGQGGVPGTRQAGWDVVFWGRVAGTQDIRL